MRWVGGGAVRVTTGQVRNKKPTKRILGNVMVLMVPWKKDLVEKIHSYF